ncbi:MAG: helix-turn-helix transcriptional regulator [Cyanobacteria bacterium P01_F01_bin.86]
MTTRLHLDHWNDWLLPGSSGDSRLLHTDVSDRIRVCPAHLGEGYFQEIKLRDDLTLVILDYTLNQNVVLDGADQGDCLELTFHLSSLSAGQSFFHPNFGWRDLAVIPARKRFFKVELFFQQPTLTPYYETFLERLSPQTYGIIEQVVQSVSHHHHRGTPGTVAERINQLHRGSTAVTYKALPGHSHELVCKEVIALNYAIRCPITVPMEQVIGQMLSCPYRGSLRRAYLERQALKLITLRFESMIQPQLNEVDLDCIYQASAILRDQFVRPPSVEVLARKVGTNRLKLNQGFHQVYGTTPYGYLRDCRLTEARRLLMSSELPIVKVAAAVGYNNRSHFAIAFRQQFGLNPKSFQMQAWQLAS